MVKNWADGNTVYSADYDETVTSTVMRFPSAAARDAVLVGDVAPVDGMHCFIVDTEYVYHVVSGTGYWCPLPGAAVVDVYATTNQTLATSGSPYVVLNMSTVAKNLGAGYVVATGKFTAPWPGHYTFHASASFASNATGYRQIYYRLSGGATMAGSGRQLLASVFTTGLPLAVTTTWYLSAGGTVEPMVLHTAGATLDLASGSGAFYASKFSVIYQGL